VVVPVDLKGNAHGSGGAADARIYLQGRRLNQLSSPQVALSVDLEGDERRPEGAGAEELLTNAADAWQYGIRPVHKKQESYHEGQVRTRFRPPGRLQPERLSLRDCSGAARRLLLAYVASSGA